MSDSTNDPDKTPSTTEEEQAEEGKALAKGVLRVGVVSILALLLAIVGLMQATGMVDLLPFGDDWTVEWLAFVLVALVLVAIELWTWRSDQI